MGFGQHLIMDISNCNINKLMDINLTYDFLLEVPKRLDMVTMTLPYVVKWLDKGSTMAGISGFIMIAESHISIHTYPIRKILYADVFSCRGFNTKRIIELFLKTFEGTNCDKRVIKRGFFSS